MRTPAVVIVAGVVAGSFAPGVAGQEEIITHERPLPRRDRSDRDLTEDDFRQREVEEGGRGVELVLGCLFLVLVLVLALVLRDRRR